MRVVPVESSMIYAVGYDEDACELEVFFRSGTVYRYCDVEKETYEKLLKAKSKGKFMNDNIIDVYDYYEVSRRR